MVKAEKFYAINKITYIHRDRGSLNALTKEQIESHVNGICALLKYSKETELSRLNCLLKDVFFDYDIKLLEQSTVIRDSDRQKFIELINSADYE